MSETQALAIVPKEEVAVATKEMDYGSLMALAKELCTTGFLPAAVKTPAQAVAIIMTGRELGLGPMQSLRSICIIQGKPELAADLQLSIFHRDGGRSKWLALTEVKAVLWLRHPNGDEHTETFTMQDAHRAGLATGMNWQKYPKAMLRSRAITAGLKSIGFEPLAGAYAPGEIGGPEIVEPEPETVLETAGDEKNASGLIQTNLSRPPATQTPPKPQVSAPPKPQAPPPSEKRYATAETRQKLIARLEPCRDLATEYFRKLDNPAVLMPNESLEDLGLQFVPLTVRQAKLLDDAITDFGNGGEAKHAYPPNELKPVEAPKPPAKITRPTETAATPKAAPSNGNKRGPEWHLAIIVPIPPQGVNRTDYVGKEDTIGSLYTRMKQGDQDAQKRLWWLVNNYEAREWVGRDGQTRQPSNADLVFREALDAFAEWHEKHGQDTEQVARDTASEETPADVDGSGERPNLPGMIGEPEEDHIPF